MVNLIMIVAIVGFVVYEWKYRAKKDGGADATKAILFALSLFGIGLLAMYLPATSLGVFNSFSILILLMVLVGVTFLWIREKSDKTQIIIMSVVLAIVLLLAFSFSPYYRCPGDGKWYTLGQTATLIEQPDGSLTLCHESIGAENDTLCHNFTGGFHGIEATTK